MKRTSQVRQSIAVSAVLMAALFLLPLEEGQKLLEKAGATALWVDGEGKLFYSPGFKEIIRT